MDIIKNNSGHWIIMHAGKEIAETFATEDAAYQWADKNIDDQVFDEPNWFTKTQIKYRTPEPQ